MRNTQTLVWFSGARRAPPPGAVALCALLDEHAAPAPAAVHASPLCDAASRRTLRQWCARNGAHYAELCGDDGQRTPPPPPAAERGRKRARPLPPGEAVISHVLTVQAHCALLFAASRDEAAHILSVVDAARDSGLLRSLRTVVLVHPGERL
jgi:hypothetical protein